jgi:hypothetical protein
MVHSLSPYREYDPAWLLAVKEDVMTDRDHVIQKKLFLLWECRRDKFPPMSKLSQHFPQSRKAYILKKRSRRNNRLTP